MRAVVLAGAAALGLGHLARAAELATYYHAGAWDAFSGHTEDDRLVCGIGNTNPEDGRRFTVRFVIGGNTAVFNVSKPNWTVPDHTQAPVVMQLGRDSPWTLQTIGEGQTLSWTMDIAAIQIFDAQFRHALSLTLNFSEGNEPPWTVPLAGSNAISKAFGRCVTDLTARSKAAGGTVPPPSQRIQPFGPAIAASASPATQPVAPAQTVPQ